MTVMLDTHDWKHDYSETRGDRFVRFEACRTCGSTRAMVSEAGGLLLKDVPEPCDVVLVRRTMEE